MLVNSDKDARQVPALILPGALLEPRIESGFAAVKGRTVMLLIERLRGTRADIDDAVPRGFKPKPNVLWETSKGQFQGLWIWRHRAPAHEAEQYSRILWQHYGGDRGAWSANKLLRVPGTVNHKPDRKGETVRLLRFDACPKRIPDLLRDVTGNRGGTLSHTIINPSLHDPQEVMRRYRPVMGAFAGTLMTATRRLRTDRSANVFAIVAKMVSVGATDDEISCVLLVNPYFNAKWGTDAREAERQINRIRGLVESDR